MPGDSGSFVYTKKEILGLIVSDSQGKNISSLQSIFDIFEDTKQVAESQPYDNMVDFKNYFTKFENNKHINSRITLIYLGIVFVSTSAAFT